MSLQHRAKVDPHTFIFEFGPNIFDPHVFFYLRAFLTSGLDGVVGRRDVPAAVAQQGKTRGSYRMGGWLVVRRSLRYRRATCTGTGPILAIRALA